MKVRLFTKSNGLSFILQPSSLLFSVRRLAERGLNGKGARRASAQPRLKGGLKRRQWERPFSSEPFKREAQVTPCSRPARPPRRPIAGRLLIKSRKVCPLGFGKRMIV